jgi:hypothetical protein
MSASAAYLHQKMGWKKVCSPALINRSGSALQLEMILQAQEYEGRQDMQLDEFFASTDGKWRTELGRQWAAEIVRRRKQSTES